MEREDIEKPALVREMGSFEGCDVSKGPDLLPSPEELDEVSENGR